VSRIEIRLELLLLLTALFASLTGASGDRAGRPVQGVAVVQAAQAAQAAVQPARRVTGMAPPSVAAHVSQIVRPLVAVAPIPSLRLAFEQRRE
jgi:hypothetical protein